MVWSRSRKSSARPLRASPARPEREGQHERFTERPAEEDAGDEWQRPPSHHQFAAADPCAWSHASAGHAAPYPVRDQAAWLQRAHGRSEAPLRREPGAGLLLWLE